MPMFDKAIVAYIDILGYQNIVEKVMSDVKVISRLEGIFTTLFADSVRGLGDVYSSVDLPGMDKDGQEYLKKIAQTTRIKCIADSCVFTLPVSEINFIYKSNDQAATVNNCIGNFFIMLTMSTTLFIAKTGTVLRGGISIGRHYESERENQLFIFSEAHNKAVALEKEARNPRILLDNTLLTYLKEIKYPHVDKFFYRDADDKRYCLDMYSTMHYMAPIVYKLLSEIQHGVTLNIKANWNNKEVLGKLLYFAKYHNNALCPAIINSNSMDREFLEYSIFTIDIDKFMTRYNSL